MFYETVAFNGDISGWDTSTVTTMAYMFYSAKAFNQDLNSWDVSRVTSMRYCKWVMPSGGRKTEKNVCRR